MKKMLKLLYFLVRFLYRGLVLVPPPPPPLVILDALAEEVAPSEEAIRI